MPLALSLTTSSNSVDVFSPYFLWSHVRIDVLFVFLGNLCRIQPYMPLQTGPESVHTLQVGLANLGTTCSDVREHLFQTFNVLLVPCRHVIQSHHMQGCCLQLEGMCRPRLSV